LIETTIYTRTPDPKILRPKDRNEPSTENPEATFYLAMLRREAGDLEGYRGFLVHPIPE
jgi:hypothetical protein